MSNTTTDTRASSNRHRLELLLFRLAGTQRFALNVLKVKEVIPAPRLTRVPHAHSAVCGMAYLRGEPLTVIDLGRAVGRPAISGREGASVIVTEFNRSMQGFLVSGVDRIAICDWEDVLPPPAGTGVDNYITGVTRIDDQLVQVLDVERILSEVVQLEVEDAVYGELRPIVQGHSILVVDDSSMARHQTAQTLDALGAEYLMARDGREALSMLRARLAQGKGGVDMVISDIEMPEMDGYTLTREIRADAQLAGLYVLLHTSINGAINAELAHTSGANDVLTKFVPAELAKAVAKAVSR
ncbi:MAG: chemotaxis protein [Gammaproteobacteria bacterium]|nr:chemotaxis protein [Gammaproteobacteria bacterium]